ncbi:hypothetical protein KOR34_46130 [Posidoniimonas corsicana]|uniref:Uncharacterized protein n=1 Tax=Posidoniimonas corsicana TaxID=1938618 RepID=A0A5C5V0D6_9BACT|nr:hypothetical protein [Posidoniimonas corsicana]TWT31237.1 hypothetical protein KOR34_46130 [Posidoniimonas corsicana]
MLFTRSPLPRLLLLGAVLFAFASEADAQRFYRRRARMMAAPAYGVGVSPSGGVSVRTPYYSFERRPGYYPGSFYGRYGWPGFSVRVQGTTSPRVQGPATPTPAGEYDPAPRDDQYAPTPTESYNLAPVYEPTVARPDAGSQLNTAYDALINKLDEFDGGAGWQKYFALTPAELADPAKTGKVLRRMDSVAADPQFAAVADLEEFRQLHAVMQAATAEASAPRRPSLGPPPTTEPEQVEAIPVPRSTGDSGPPPEPRPSAGGSSSDGFDAPSLLETGPRTGGERSVLKDE